MRRIFATASAAMVVFAMGPSIYAQTTTQPSGTATTPSTTTATPTPPATTAPVTTTAPAPATPPAATTPATPPAPGTATGTGTPPADTASPVPETEEDGEGPVTTDDDFSIGDIPVVDIVELEEAKARKALDVYVLVRDKYKDAQLEEYEDLQDFVDQSPQGKTLEADIKAAGFTTVNEWNTYITSISFAYANVVDDQTDEIKQQIEELKQDNEMAQDMRERMIKALTAMITSDNNRKVIDTLMKDATYGEKLKQLDTEEE